MKKIFFLFVFFPFISIAQHDNEMIIAFGSCDNQELPHVMWKPIIANNPDLWVWMGDIVYMDSEDMEITKEAYDKQKSNSDYKQLIKQTNVIGIWDDHDYGFNDGGKNWPVKDLKKEVMFDFLNEPENSPRRAHKGVYISYDYYLNDVDFIHVIMLDGRYFRDTLTRSDNPDRRYDPNPYGVGTLLGEIQWTWLNNELTNSKAVLNLIISGIQVLSVEHGFESWGNFPHERDRLLKLIKDSKARNVLILSGDRHIAEISEMDVKGLPYPLFDITSSGLTHSYEGADERNRYRVSPLIDQKNFGVLDVKLLSNSLQVEVDIRGENDTLFIQKTITYGLDY